MTNERAVEILSEVTLVYEMGKVTLTQKEINEALDMAIKALRYKPIILQEHDADSRRLRAILDTTTEEIYVIKLTKQGADILGITIEEVDIDGDDE